MRSPFPSDECARAREWVSLRLDDQLSDFEEVLLEAHLARCAECRSVAVSVVGLTTALRSAPLDEPAFTFQPPRRTRGRTALRAVSAAAAVAVVGLSGIVSLQLSTSRPRPSVIHADRKVIGLKERQMNELTPTANSQPQIRQGVEAARLVTVTAAPEPARARPSTQGISAR